MHKERTKTGTWNLSWLTCIFFLLISPFICGQSENIRFKRISTEQGLPQSTINCILQDKKGFMWFGTQEGLNRYDGYDFKCYKHNPDDQTTITDSYIWCIIEDKSGILWIGTNDGGLNSFDPTTERFTSYQNDPNDYSSLSHNYVRTVFEDNEGVLWIGTYGGGLNKFNRITKSFTRYQYDPSKNNSLSNNNVTSIIEDQFGNLWIGTDGGGINIYDQKTDKFLKHEYNKKGPSSLSNNNVMCIFKDRSGDIWIGTQGGGLNKFDRNTGKFKQFTTDNSELSYNNILCIYEDIYGILWIGTEGGGVNKLDKKTEQFTIYKHNAAIPHSLSNDVVMSIYEDNSGIIWIGTYFGGLNKHNPRSNKFALFQQYPGIDNSLSSNDIRAIYEDRTGTLWIGTYSGGLNKIDRTSGKYTHYTTYNSKLSHNDVRCILEDCDGFLWIGTRGGGLNRFDKKTEKFKYYTTENSKLSHDWIRVIYEDRSRNLWVGTEGGGLNKFDKKNNNFKRYTTSNSKLSDDIVFSIYEDRSGFLWIGTRGGGLNKFDPKTEEFTHYTTENSNLSHNFVLSIYEDNKGNLWIGTYGGGLNKIIDREKGIFKSYREKDGLPNNVIYGILEDNQGNLWLSTNNGISKFDPQNKIFKNYDINDGLQSNEFNAGAYFKSQDGKIFFGGINGFNSFFPEKIKSNTFVPPVVITYFFIYNESVKPQWQSPGSPLKKVIHEMREITLSHQQESFSFEFTALDYTSPQKNQYKYKLEGYKNEWIPTDYRNRRATYTNLPSENYVFRVKGSNNDGLWNEKSTSIKIKITPPPWKTWWAYTLYLFAFILLAYLIWSAWSKRFLKQMVEERTKELNLKNEELEKKHQELKITESQLVHSEKMAGLGSLVAGVAHEINNPASFAQTAAYNLNKDIEKLKSFLVELAGDEADKEILNAFDDKFNVLFNHLTAIKEGTSRISKTVNDLRTFSRLEKGEMKPIKLLEVLQVTLNLVRTQYKEIVEFVTDFQANPEVKGNTAELNQVFMNIMVNSCQAIKEKQKRTGEKIRGTLTIQTTEENEYAVIRFQDTGMGMSEAVQGKMFDPFFTTRPEGEGTGLGLSISYNIIRQHHGWFEVSSEEGKGTTVTLYFPLARKPLKTTDRR